MRFKTRKTLLFLRQFFPENITSDRKLTNKDQRILKEKLGLLRKKSLISSSISSEKRWKKKLILLRRKFSQLYGKKKMSFKSFWTIPVVAAKKQVIFPQRM